MDSESQPRRGSYERLRPENQPEPRRGSYERLRPADQSQTRRGSDERLRPEDQPQPRRGSYESRRPPKPKLTPLDAPSRLPKKSPGPLCGSPPRSPRYARGSPPLRLRRRQGLGQGYGDRRTSSPLIVIDSPDGDSDSDRDNVTRFQTRNNGRNDSVDHEPEARRPSIIERMRQWSAVQRDNRFDSVSSTNSHSYLDSPIFSPLLSPLGTYTRSWLDDCIIWCCEGLIRILGWIILDVPMFTLHASLLAAKLMIVVLAVVFGWLGTVGSVPSWIWWYWRMEVQSRGLDRLLFWVGVSGIVLWQVDWAGVGTRLFWEPVAADRGFWVLSE